MLLPSSGIDSGFKQGRFAASRLKGEAFKKGEGGMNRRNARSRAPKSRREARLRYWMYGMHAVLEALSNPSRRKHRLLMTRNSATRVNLDPGLPHLEREIVESRELSRILGTESAHQGLALEVAPLSQPEFRKFDETLTTSSRIILLDRVTDPQNIGAIIRSARAFGVSAVIVTARNSPSESAAMTKSACGAFEHVRYLRVGNLSMSMKRLRDRGVILVGLDAKAPSTLCEVAANLQGHAVGMVLGSEGAGMRRLTLSNCDFMVRIQSSTEAQTLNVSNAAAIALHAMAFSPQNVPR